MTKTQLPLVSICIPTYNGEAFIDQAMKSAISQSYSHLEIVVSDDESKDRTLEIIESYKTKTTIPIQIYQHKPKGIGANWNHCVLYAKGNYIKFLFQDDVLKPECIETMMATAMKNPRIGLIYCKREFIYKELTPDIDEFINMYSNLHTHWDSFGVNEDVLSGKTYLKDRQLLNSPKNKIGEPTAVLLRKDCFETVGWFNEDLEQTLDCDYWYRIMKSYDVAFIDNALVFFRLHNRQASFLNKSKELPDKLLLYQQYYTHLFWYLHFKNKMKLLKLFHPIFKTLVLLKRIFQSS